MDISGAHAPGQWYASTVEESYPAAAASSSATAAAAASTNAASAPERIARPRPRINPPLPPPPSGASFSPVSCTLFFLPLSSSPSTAEPGLLSVFYATQCTCECQGRESGEREEEGRREKKQEEQFADSAAMLQLPNSHSSSIQLPGRKPSPPLPRGAVREGKQVWPPGSVATATCRTNPLFLPFPSSPFPSPHPFLFHTAFLPLKSYVSKSRQKRVDAREIACERVRFDPHAHTEYFPLSSSTSKSKPGKEEEVDSDIEELESLPSKKKEKGKAGNSPTRRKGEGVEVEEVDTSAPSTASRKKSGSDLISTSIPFTFGLRSHKPFSNSKIASYLQVNGAESSYEYTTHPHLAPIPGTPIQFLSLAPATVAEMKQFFPIVQEKEFERAKAQERRRRGEAMQLMLMPNARTFASSDEEMSEAAHHVPLASVGRTNSATSHLTMAQPFQEMVIHPHSDAASDSGAMSAPSLPYDERFNSRRMRATVNAARSSGIQLDQLDEAAQNRLCSVTDKPSLLQYVHAAANKQHGERQFYAVQEDGWYSIHISSYVDCRCTCGQVACMDVQTDSANPHASFPSSEFAFRPVSRHRHLIHATIRFGVTPPVADFDVQGRSVKAQPGTFYRDVLHMWSSGSHIDPATSHMFSSNSTVLSNADTHISEKRQKQIQEMEQLAPPRNWRPIRCGDDISPQSSVLILNYMSPATYVQLRAQNIETILELAEVSAVRTPSADSSCVIYNSSLTFSIVLFSCVFS
jgi:hypothetical protein